jgi:hypothetical protein
MIRRHLTALLLAVLVATGLTLIGPTSTTTAHAAITKNGCATKYEWRRVKRGMTLARARNIIDHRGRLTDQTEYSDGDEWRTYKFRQCGRSWRNSSLYLSVSLTERRTWVPDEYCYWEDYDYDGYDDEYVCEDYGYYETYYTTPFRVRSKLAYWS